jgi:hypothetical protein
MPRERLTETLVLGLTPSGRGAVIWDTELWGFGCRLPGSGGEPTYFVYYRTWGQGLRRRLDLGTRRSLTCAQARKMAQDLIGRNAPHQFGRVVPKSRHPASSRGHERREPASRAPGSAAPS